MSHATEQDNLQQEFDYLTSLLATHKQNQHEGCYPPHTKRTWRKPFGTSHQLSSTQHGQKSYMPSSHSSKQLTRNEHGYGRGAHQGHTTCVNKNKYSLVNTHSKDKIPSKSLSNVCLNPAIVKQTKNEKVTSGSSSAKSTTGSSTASTMVTRTALAKQFVLSQLQQEISHSPSGKPSNSCKKREVRHEACVPSVNPGKLTHERTVETPFTYHETPQQLKSITSRMRVHINPKLLHQIQAQRAVDNCAPISPPLKQMQRSMSITPKSRGASSTLAQVTKPASRGSALSRQKSPTLSHKNTEVSSNLNYSTQFCQSKSNRKKQVSSKTSLVKVGKLRQTPPVQNSRYKLVRTESKLSHKTIVKAASKQSICSSNVRKAVTWPTNVTQAKPDDFTISSGHVTNLSLHSVKATIQPPKSGSVSSLKPTSAVNKKYKWVRASPQPLKASTPIQDLETISSFGQLRRKTPRLVAKGKYKLVKVRTNPTSMVRARRENNTSKCRISQRSGVVRNYVNGSSSRYKFVRKSVEGLSTPHVTPVSVKIHKTSIPKPAGFPSTPSILQFPQLVAVNKYKMVRSKERTPASLQTSWRLLTKYKLIRQARVANQKKGRKISEPAGRSNASKSTWKLDRRTGSGIEQSRRGKMPGLSTRKQWRSRYSIKRDNSTSGSPVVFGQIQGRKVRNASRSPFKFIRGLGEATSRLRIPTRHRLKLDHRISCAAGSQSKRYPRAGQKFVSIGGILYKSSKTCLKRTGLATRPAISASKTRSLRRNMSQKMRNVVVRGVRFQVTAGGKTLKRVGSKDGTISSGKMKRVDLGGVTYIQTKPGTLVRASTRAKRIFASRSINKSIATATRYKKTNLPRRYCMFYSRFGKCNRGDKCPYTHDPKRVAICTRFLRGRCRVTDCPFSHAVSKEKMPVCRFFLRGVCNKEDCPYLHVNVRSDAEICPDFLKGYCALGEKCKKRHSHVCQVFIDTGSCPKGRLCPLQHPRHSPRRSYNSRNPGTHSGSQANHTETSKSRLAVEAEEEWEDDIDLPLSQRHLPAYISLNSGPSLASISTLSTNDQSKGEPLQIKPRLSSSSESSA